MKNDQIFIITLSGEGNTAKCLVKGVSTLFNCRIESLIKDNIPIGIFSVLGNCFISSESCIILYYINNFKH